MWLKGGKFFPFEDHKQFIATKLFGIVPKVKQQLVFRDTDIRIIWIISTGEY